MKENLPLIDFVASLIGVADIKYFQHRFEGALVEILMIGNVVKELTLKKVTSASWL